MSERYPTLNLENPMDYFITKKNEELRKKIPTAPIITQHWFLVGQTMSGKSYLLKSYLYNDMCGVYDQVYWVCPTWEEENYKDLFCDIDEKKDVLIKFTEDDIIKILEESEKKFKANDGDYHTLIILDDVAKIFKDYSTFINMIATCRHYSVTLIASVQDVRMMPLDVRQQFVCWSVWANIGDESVDRIGKATPLGGKVTKKYVNAVKKLNEDGNRGFLYLNKEFPNKALFNFDNFIELD